MYVPVLPARPVRLACADGSVTLYPSLRTFVEAHGIHWVRFSIGPAFRVCGCATHCRSLLACPHLQTYPWVLRDHEGEVVCVEQCEAVWREIRQPAPWRYGRYRFWNGQGPVPYTGKHGTGHWYRRIRTFGEHRAAVGVVREAGEPAFRAARTRHNLPSAWDDQRVVARKDRSWKRFRTTQWKLHSKRGRRVG